MKILVTGGTGYLGGRIVDYTARETNNFITIASRSSVINHLFSNKINYIKIDWDDDKSILEITKDIDIVIHLAGMNSQDCADQPKLATKVNVTSTRSLIRSSIRNGVKKFIYISTAHVYKSPLEGYINENTPTENSHPYAKTHLLGEQAILDASNDQAIQPIILRLSNAFGAPMSKEVNCWMLLLNDLCLQALSDKELVIKSTGKQRRDFICITDVCRAIGHFIQLPKRKISNSVFNLGGNWAPTIEEITRLFVSRFSLITGVNLPIKLSQIKDIAVYPELKYDIKRIEETGFSIGGKQSINNELDKLIKFSIKNMR